MRLRSRRSATRCSSDRRFSRNKILASSAARAQTGRWRAVMQALGHRVGSQSATSGVARSGAIVQRAGSVRRHRRLRHQPGHAEHDSKSMALRAYPNGRFLAAGPYSGVAANVS